MDTLLKEIETRRNEASEPIRTIYIGGGTPSTLEPIDIQAILRTIGIGQAEEVSMEMNPGDMNEQYLHQIKQAGVNRLSLGIQSFQDSLLQVLGRRHTAKQAIDAVHLAQQAGFDNISVDLMYALPGQTLELWQSDIEIALQLGIQHISTYGLMYEEGTALTKMVETGEIEAKEAGFEHYEVSNFALPGYESKHNSSYWDGTQYIGVGAGAHSYIGHVRSWNPSDLETYIIGINKGTLVRESETLTDNDLYNERIMLGLRTCRGITESIPSHSRSNIDRLIAEKLLKRTDDGRIVATQKGLHILNRIIEDLMI